MESEYQSGFSQGIRAYEINPVKRTFKVLVADRATVATSPKTGQQVTYHPKSHAKALLEWKGRPLIANHGRLGFKILGEVLSADIVEEGLVHEIRVDDDRMLELISKKAYEGFSIGTGVPEADENIQDGEIQSYVPVELSVIMYPEAPACPKGVCDIISMMTSCKHTHALESVKEVKTMAEHTHEISAPAATAAPAPCGCKDKVADMISSAQHLVVVSAKDEKIKELMTQIQTLTADVKSKSDLLVSAQTQIGEFEKKEKLILAASLPQNKGLDYAQMSLDEINRLLVIHNSAKVEVTQTAGASEVATPSAEEQKKATTKPWLGKKYKAGDYSY